MTDDDRYDYQQQLEELRRQDAVLNAAERARFAAAHPGYGQCPKHPERAVVNSGVCNLRYCAECIENHKRAYIDAPQRDSSSDYSIVGNELHYCGRYVGPMKKER